MTRLSELIHEAQDILFEIAFRDLEEGRISEQDLNSLIVKFTNFTPIVSVEELLGKLKQLAESYPQAARVHFYILEKLSDEKRKEILAFMRRAIQEGDMDAALSIAKDI